MLHFIGKIIMPAKVISINIRAEEVNQFKAEVRPSYAEKCMRLWKKIFSPLFGVS